MKILEIVKTFNRMLALRTTLIVSTVWCVYAFVILSMLPIWMPKLQSGLLYFSNCLQLIFLPLIMVGQSILNEHSDRQAAEDHQMLMDELQELQDMHEELKTLILKREQS